MDPKGKVAEILLIEDNVSFAEALVYIFSERLGYHVTWLSSGDKLPALLALGLTCDLALIDYVLPGQHNGIELCRILHEAQSGAVPCILLTGFFDVLEQQLGGQTLPPLGVSEVVVKGGDLSGLATVIQRWLPEDKRLPREKLEAYDGWRKP